MKLSIKNLYLRRANKKLFDNFSYDFPAGKIFALVGNNGSGKTTFLKALSGLFAIDPGTVFVDAKDLTTMSALFRANIISLLLQHTPEQPYCTAESRIAHGLMPIYGFNYSPDDEAIKLINNIAKRFSIQHLLKRSITEMSGGEQRLVHLAKCLVSPRNKIILLDEPSAFLDFSQQYRLGLCLKEEAEKNQLIIFSSHDAGFIDRYADGIIKIENGFMRVITKDQRPSSFSLLDKSEASASLTFTFS